MASRKIEWSMACEVNGECFDFHAQGRGDLATGEVALDFAPTDFPTGFDPVSCPLICNAPATIGFARQDETLASLLEVSGGTVSVSPARCGTIFDAAGREVLRLSVASVVFVRDDALTIGNEMKGFSQLPRIAKNFTPVTEYVLPNGPGAALSSIRFKMIAEDGQILTGLTVVPYAWEGDAELPRALARTFELIDVRWDGQRNVSSLQRTSIRPLKGMADEVRGLASVTELVAAH